MGWKLIDSGSALHDLEVMQNVKKKDEDGMAKAEEELVHQSPDVFKDLNQEPLNVLPILYNSLIGCDHLPKHFQVKGHFLQGNEQTEPQFL